MHALPPAVIVNIACALHTSLGVAEASYLIPSCMLMLAARLQADSMLSSTLAGSPPDPGWAVPQDAQPAGPQHGRCASSCPNAQQKQPNQVSAASPRRQPGENGQLQRRRSSSVASPTEQAQPASQQSPPKRCVLVLRTSCRGPLYHSFLAQQQLFAIATYQHGIAVQLSTLCTDHEQYSNKRGVFYVLQ